MQVDIGELLRDEIKQTRLGEPIDLGVKVEAFKDVANRGREGLQIGVEVFLDVVLIPHQAQHVERRGVKKQLAGLAEQERLGVQLGLGAFVQFGQDSGLGSFENAIQPA